MKKATKLTFLTAALSLFLPQFVLAETVTDTTTTLPTTSEETTQLPTTQQEETTTEKTTEAPVSLPTDAKNDIYYYKPGERPPYTGILRADGNIYYHEKDKPVTSTWKWAENRYFYFGEDGKMVRNGLTPDGYLVDNEGMLVSPGWSHQGGKWYYALSGGKVFRGDWKKIDGVWYAFHDNGVMYSHEWSGSYFLKDSGAMADNEWVFDRNYNSWFYIKPGGVYASRQWKGDYYLKSGGYMAKSEFIYDPNYKATYYLKEDGSYARSQWLLIQNKWYHFQKAGEMDKNKWVGAYYVKEDGSMAEKEWIYDGSYGGWFYLQEGGSYVRNLFTIDGKKHVFQSDGLWVAEVPEAVNYGQYKNVIFLDPGHGGKDPGAVYNGLREKDLNMQIYRKLRSELERLGYTVLTSRDKDEFVDFVTERSQMANKTDADFFISIHFNASGVRGQSRSGVETYIYEADEDLPPRINKEAHDNPLRMSESKRLAENLHASIIEKSGAKDRGIRGASFAVLRETAKPAVLLELGYMDGPESKKISDSAYQDKLVAGIVSGIQNFYKTTK